MSAIDTRALDRELKRGSAELLSLSLLDARARHGYDLSKLIEIRSGGQKRVLAQQRKTWASFVESVRRVTGDEGA